MHITCEILLHEFRQGTIGKICLETPQMAIVEQAHVEEKLAQEALEGKVKKKKPKKKRR